MIESTRALALALCVCSLFLASCGGEQGSASTSVAEVAVDSDQQDSGGHQQDDDKDDTGNSDTGGF